MSKLPNGWAKACIGDLADLNPKQAFDDETVAGFVPMSHAPTNFRDKLRFDERPWGEIKKAYTNFKDGDVIFAKVTPCFENGKAAFVEGLPNGVGAGSSEFFVLRPSCDGVSAKYLLALVKSYDFLLGGAENMTGAVGLRRVPKQFVERYLVPVAPAAEQTRIAAKLDELLAQVDTLKARIDGIPALLKRFRQSVLAAAISGRLTEDWHQAHAAEAEWKKTAIKSVCSAAFDGPFGSKLKSDDYESEGVRVVRLENIGHLVFFAEKETFISTVKFKQLAKNKLEPGDILFSSFVDEEIRVCQLPKTEETFINKADCFCLRVDRTVAKPEFVLYALAAKQTYLQIKDAVHGATRPRINLGFLKGFEINLPSPTEQVEIIRRVEQLFAFLSQLEVRAQIAKTHIDGLTQSILAKAFRGELVQQDPNDEPADMLLDRIKAQRAAAPKDKRGRRSTTEG